MRCGSSLSLQQHLDPKHYYVQSVWRKGRNWALRAVSILSRSFGWIYVSLERSNKIVPYGCGGGYCNCGRFDRFTDCFVLFKPCRRLCQPGCHVRPLSSLYLSFTAQPASVEMQLPSIRLHRSRRLRVLERG